MVRSAVAADLLTIINNCLGPQCRYQLARTRGIAPAVCPSITTSWIERVSQSFGDCDGDCDFNSTHRIRITITDICMGPDAADEFDFDAEDAAAVCFEDEVDQIEECLQCHNYTQLRLDHQLISVRYDSTTFDVEAEGGGYSAYIELTILAAECCRG